MIEKAKKYGICLACGEPFSKDDNVYLGCVHVHCRHSKVQVEPTEAKPTIEELEKLLDGPTMPIEIMPDGSIRAVEAEFAKQPGLTEFMKTIKDVLKVMPPDGKFHRKIMEQACDLLDRQAEALNPVREWYGNRTDLEILTDAIADLQIDRAQVLTRAAEIKWLEEYKKYVESSIDVNKMPKTYEEWDRTVENLAKELEQALKPKKGGG